MHSGGPSCAARLVSSSIRACARPSRLVRRAARAVPAPCWPRRLAAPSPAAALRWVRPGQSCKSRRRARRALSFAQPSSLDEELLRAPYILQRALRRSRYAGQSNLLITATEARGKIADRAKQLSKWFCRSSADHTRSGWVITSFCHSQLGEALSAKLVQVCAAIVLTIHQQGSSNTCILSADWRHAAISTNSASKPFREHLC